MTTQACAEQPAAVAPDTTSTQELPDRTDRHTDRHGTRPPLSTP
ncbi:hypothetical protein [Streptomyces narbonensis]